MASVNANSTPESLRQIYFENLSYATDNDTTKAKRFREVCMAILALPEELEGAGRSRLRFNHAEIRRQLDDVKKWQDRNDAAGRKSDRVIHVDFRDFRS